MQLSNLPPNTQQKLLLVASEIFARKGYQDTTIAEICKLAGTNIASVNYHFKGKANLYFEAWRYAFQQDLLSHPSDGGVDINSSVEVRLIGRIKSLIARISDPNSHFFAIVHKEMAQQTHLLQKIIQQEIYPQKQAMKALIKELLGPNAVEKHVQFCHASIIGQCFHLLALKNMGANADTAGDIMEINDVHAYAEHVVQFSLAGIYALRTQLNQTLS